MKKVYRQLLFFISTVVFLALAPLVILYAMGYRTLTSSIDPIPVGVVLIETFPRRADVIVSNQVLGRTPRAIPNVPAGNIPITIRKDGYHEWHKNVPVKPGLVTELRGIRLFSKNSEPQVLATNVELYSISPNRQLLAVYFSSQTLQLFDKDGEAVGDPLPLRQPPNALLWAPDNASLLLRNQNETYSLYLSTTPGQQPRTISALARAEKVDFDPRIASRLITLSTAGALRAYNVSTSSGELISQGIEHMGISGRGIYGIDISGALKIFNLQGALQQTIPLNLSAKVMQLLVTTDGKVALLLENKELLLWRDDAVVPISGDVNYAQWSPDGRTLLIQRETNSLYIYNESDERSSIPLQELQLVVRLSRPIMHPQWFAGGGHVVYQVDDEVVITETDTRDHALSHVVDTTNLGNAQVIVGEAGETLLYLKHNGTSASLVLNPLVEDQ